MEREPVFKVEHGAIVMIDAAGPWRMSERSAQQLLDVYEREGEVRRFNALSDAVLALSDPKNVVAAMLSASVAALNPTDPPEVA